MFRGAQLNLVQETMCFKHRKGRQHHMWCLFWFRAVEWNGGKQKRGRDAEGGPVECKPEQKLLLPLGGDKTWCNFPTSISPLLPACNSSSSGGTIQLSFTSPAPTHPLRDRFWCQKEAWLLTQSVVRGRMRDLRDVSATGCHPATSNDNRWR